MDDRRGWFRQKLHRLAAAEQELEAEDLQEQSEKAGATAVQQCSMRRSVCIAGTVRSVTLAPVGGAPALEADLYDGSGSVTLVFLGRRRIAGIEAGRSLVARGRLTRNHGRRTIFNPRYDLLPADYATR